MDISPAMTKTPESSPILNNSRGSGDNLLLQQLNADHHSLGTNNRISTLDACYEVVKEKLEKLREEIRRIRINKQQEQLQQSIQAKRNSVDSNGSSSANSQLLVLPSLPGSGHHLRPSPNHASPARTRQRYRMAEKDASANRYYSTSSNDEGAGDDSTLTRSNVSARSRRQFLQQQNDGNSTPKRSPKPRLARQSQVTNQEPPAPPNTTSGKEGSESPVWVLPGSSNRNKSLTREGTRGKSSPPVVGETKILPTRKNKESKNTRESPHPVRLVSDHSFDGGSGKEAGGLSIQVLGDSASSSPAVNKVFLSPAPIKDQPQQQAVKSPTIIQVGSFSKAHNDFKPTTQRPMLGQIKMLDRLSKGGGETTPTRKMSRSDSASELLDGTAPRSLQQQQQNQPPLALSTHVLPSHANMQPSNQPQVPAMKRPPRSFTVRTNATPDNDLETSDQGAPRESSNASSTASTATLNGSNQSSKATLPMPNAHPPGHSMSLSPQKCLILPVSAVINVDAPMGSRGNQQQKALTPSVPLLKSEQHLLQNVDLTPPQQPSTSQQPRPPRQLLIDTLIKSPSNPVINNQKPTTSTATTGLPPPVPSSQAGSTPLLVGGIKPLTVKAQQPANKLISNVMATATGGNSLLSNDSSSYENLDQASSSGSAATRVASSTVRSVASSSTSTSASKQQITMPSSPPAAQAAPVPAPVPVPVPQHSIAPSQTGAAALIAKQKQPIKQQLQQRKSAILPGEAEHNNNKQQGRRAMAFQRNSFDLGSPLPLSMIGAACGDTDSELEGIFGECEAIDDFDVSSTMSDSPSMFATTDVNIWPVMIGNNVVAMKRRTKASSSADKQKKKDPPQMADASQAALIANRRGSLARPRPTLVVTNKSAADLHSAATSSQIISSSTNSVPAPPNQQPSVVKAPVQSPEQSLAPASQHDKQPVPIAASTYVPSSSSSSSLQAKAAALNSPKIAPTALAALRRQRAQMAQPQAAAATQQQTTQPPVPTSSSSGKPSLTGLLYGDDAANMAKQHLSQYTFRGNAQQSSAQPVLGQRGSLSKSVITGAKDHSVPRPVAGGGTLTVGSPPSSQLSPNSANLSIANLIFNNPLQTLAAHHQQQQAALPQVPPQSQTTPHQIITKEQQQPRQHHRHHHHRHSQRLSGGASDSSGTTASATVVPPPNAAAASSQPKQRRGTLGAPIEALAQHHQPHHPSLTRQQSQAVS